MAEPVSGPCVNCWVRPATIVWIGDGGALAYIHGGGQPWCERCALVAQISYAREMATKIIDLEQRLVAFDAQEVR